MSLDRLLHDPNAVKLGVLATGLAGLGSDTTIKTNSKFSSFVSTIKKMGLAKQYYTVDFQYPPMYAGFDVNLLQMIPFYVAAVNAPGIELATQTVKDTGINRKVVVDKDYGTLTTTFYCDSGMATKKFFDYWIRDIINSQGGKFAYPSQYTVPAMSISHVNAAKDDVYTVALANAYPIAVSEVSMSHDSSAPLAFSVVWTYESWASNQIPQAGVDIPKPGFGDAMNKVLNEVNKFRALATDPTKVNAILGLLR